MAKSSSKSSAPAAGSSAANRQAIINRQSTGMTQGSSTISTPAAAVASGSTAVKPTANSMITALNSMGTKSTTPKIDPATGRLTSPMEMQAISPAGGGGSYTVTKDTINPSNEGKTFGGGSSELQFGSDLMKAINAAKGQLSPFNISAAQKSPTISQQLKGIGSYGGSRLDFNFNPSATDSSTLMKTSVTPTPAPMATASKTGVSLPAASPKAGSIGGGTYLGAKANGYTGNYTQWVKDGRPTNGTGKQDENKPEEPVIPPEQKKEEEPIIPENIPVPNTTEGIQSAIMQAMQPSAEENAIQAQLDKETEALGQGLVEVEDRPVALPFITGMSSSLEKRSALRTAPLQNQLARLQNARLGKLQALQTQLGFKNDELTRNFQKTSQDFTNKVALATKGLRYDTATDTFYKDESLAGADTDPVEKAKLEQGLRKEYTDEAKNFQSIRDSYARMLEAAKDPSAAGDIALIFSYMKVLDPTSVVREGEFATAANAGSVPDSIRNMWNKALTGERISVNRNDFMNQAGNMFRAANEQHQQRVKTYTAIATSAGVSPENVVTDLGLPDSISSLIGKGATGPQDFNTDLTAGGGAYPTATYPDVNSKVQSAINDIRAGYSKKQIQDYYHLTDAQYLQLTQSL